MSITDKLETIKTELNSVLKKEQEVEATLLQVKELKLKYIGAVEVLEQLDEESNSNNQKKDKKDK